MRIISYTLLYMLLMVPCYAILAIMDVHLFHVEVQYVANIFPAMVFSIILSVMYILIFSRDKRS